MVCQLTTYYQPVISLLLLHSNFDGVHDNSATKTCLGASGQSKRNASDSHTFHTPLALVWTDLMNLHVSSRARLSSSFHLGL